MPSDRIIRIGVIDEDLDDWAPPPPMYAGETINGDEAILTLASIENMLGMNSTVDIVNDIKSYIMSNLTPIDEYTGNRVEPKVDRLIEALGRGNYIPTRRVYRTPPTHIVHLDDERLEKFINKISKCSYIKWRLASPIYWGWDNIGLEGVFKR